jgi:chromosome segregation ATPase
MHLMAAKQHIALRERAERGAELHDHLQRARQAHFKQQRAKLEALGERAAALHGALGSLNERRLAIYHRRTEEMNRLQFIETDKGTNSSEFTSMQESVNELTERSARIEAEYAARCRAWADAARLYEACKKWLDNAMTEFDATWHEQNK